MVEEENRSRRRRSFDLNAEIYHSARPGYPPALFQRLGEVCGLGMGQDVLELGAGTGQATECLLQMGARVVAVEPGANLARRLRANLDEPGLTVVESDFEDAELPEASFDLAVAATSLHWLDLSISLPKIARLLRPGAWLAAWWTVFRDPDPQRVTPFRHALEGLFRRHDLGRGGSGLPNPLDHNAWVAEFTKAAVFNEIRVEDFRQSVPFTSTRLTALFSTFTEISDLPTAERDRLLNDVSALVNGTFGGQIVENHVTVLFLAR
ncbi:class I SAM-dependent methyltransferase [Streptomyces sp. NPDC001070]